MTTRIWQGSVILSDRVLERGQVVVENGVIAAVAADCAYTPTDDVGSCFIAPGFIDTHTHGIAGADTMDADHASLATMARRFRAHGVTAFLPTTITQPLEMTRRALQSVRTHMERAGDDRELGARVLGAHLEGPWIAHDYKGAQNAAYICAPEPDVVTNVLAAGAGTVRVVTLAPELPGAEDAIRIARARGARVSLGHSGATYDEALRAVGLGASRVTHCFNGMVGLHHRKPGLAGAALQLPELFVELIADGVHVHPVVMRLLLACAGRDRVMLVTDSISATELPDGAYALGGQEVAVRDGTARLRDGTLAGSTLTMDRAVWNMTHLCGVALPDAVYMAATTPAASLGLSGHKGRIGAGYDADLTVLDADLRPVQTIVGGRPQQVAESQ